MSQKHQPSFKAIVDSGATDHFMPMDYKGNGESMKGDNVTVYCANDTTMESKATDILNNYQVGQGHVTNSPMKILAAPFLP